MNEHPPSVLVIDDERAIRRFVRAGLELQSFTVIEADNGATGLREATLRSVDLIILDLALPDMDGADVLERLRSWSTVPVIVLSVRSREEEKVRLLELGADDYVTKPFGMAELIARSRAALRRHVRGAQANPVVHAGPLEIDLPSRRVTLGGELLQLSPKEYRLLQVLAQHAGNVVTQQYLLSEIWGKTHANDAHYLRILVRKLRHKIEAVPTRPTILITELGVGYRLANPTVFNNPAG
jgi:two-component system KDP operon response regulator KdpE